MQGLRKLPLMYDADVTCVNILLSQSPKTSMLRLFCCYFPQNDYQAASELSFYEYLSDLKIDYPNDKFLLVGDFNIRVARWISNPQSSDSNLYLENPHDNILTSQLFAFLCFNDWSQYNHVNNMNDRQLDLVISDLKCIVQRVAPLSLPEDAHHPSLCIDISIDYTSSLCPATRIARRFHAADYDEINREMSNINWDDHLNLNDIDVAVDNFYKVVRDVINRFVPHKVVKSNNKYPVWFNKRLIKLINRKHKLHKKWKSYGRQCDYDNFSNARRDVKEYELYAMNNLLIKLREIFELTPSTLGRSLNQSEKAVIYLILYTLVIHMHRRVRQLLIYLIHSSILHLSHPAIMS
ncbi:unnamed protein product [Parnassius apollo]|uniref:(apollo) hypothetical protein n=1 Tax=Parnassius apollo TaxID=110799 RepID=A0A8S3WCV3_PARAO|nr:unnamed protein product [Parnassius apollo]